MTFGYFYNSVCARACTCRGSPVTSERKGQGLAEVERGVTVMTSREREGTSEGQGAGPRA